MGFESVFETAGSRQRNPGPDQPLATGQLRVAALGDLMLAGEWNKVVQDAGVQMCLQQLRSLCGDAVVFGNLEVTADGGSGVISKEPRIIGEPQALSSCLQHLDLDVVCVSNNHAFDALWGGFEVTRRILEEHNVCFLGAGRDLSEAGRPLRLDRNGLRLAWLAYTEAGARPSHVAGPDSFGVNPLDPEIAGREIRSLRDEVDHVVVSLHWGVEYSHLPSPQQVALARSLVDCGASLVLGHHAHVLQGIEEYKGGVIAYNLGNALATDLQIDGRLAIRQTRRSRSSVVLRATLSKKRVEGIELVPFRVRGTDLQAGDPYAERLLVRATRQVERGISPARWKASRLYEDVVLRTFGKLHPSVVGSIRGRHIANLLRNTVNALRGRGPA